MAARSIEARLAQLRAVRGSADRAGALREIKTALGGKSGLMIAAAVKLVIDDDHAEAIAELPAAFARLCEDAIKRDPGCRGKMAIARAMVEAGQWHDDVFERGIRYVQPEPTFGGREDTAAGLRGLCAMAYAQLSHPDAIEAIAEVLADPQPAARLGAAQALGDSGRADAIPLLRLKLLVGDAEPEIQSAAFGSLLALEPGRSLQFVARFLDQPRGPGQDETAALALGESRLADALPILIAWTDRATTTEPRRIGQIAIALLRLDAGTEHLLRQIGDRSAEVAVTAIEALASFRHDVELVDRVMRAAEANEDPDVARAARRVLER